MFVILRSPKPQCFMSHSWHFGELSWVGVHWLGLRMFGTIMWKLLIIESINLFYFNFNFNIYWNLGCFWHCWKAIGELDLIKFISQFSKLKCGRYWFLNEFFFWKFKQIAKIRFGRKNQLSPQCLHIAKFKNFQF